jgi:hypothetical protein
MLTASCHNQRPSLSKHLLTSLRKYRIFLSPLRYHFLTGPIP